MGSPAGKIVIIGGGGHAKVVASVLRKTAWAIVGYTDVGDRGSLLGAPYLGEDSVLPRILESHNGCRAVIGIGKIDPSSKRQCLQAGIEKLGFEFPVVVSPQAVVNDEVTLAPGTVVLDGAVVNSGTIIGKACIVNSNSVVEHDCRLGDDVHVAPGATVSGGVSIGDECVIGAGATIVHGLAICRGCLVGAGAVVIKDMKVPGMYGGNPARRIR